MMYLVLYKKKLFKLVQVYAFGILQTLAIVKIFHFYN